ncbi:MAG: PRC-barrel domain-containing protein [Pseudolabrys sp.]
MPTIFNNRLAMSSIAFCYPRACYLQAMVARVNFTWHSVNGSKPRTRKDRNSCHNHLVVRETRMRQLVSILFTALALGVTVAPAAFGERAFVIAQQTPAGADTKGDDSLQTKFNRRFPQEVKVGHLIGMPVLDDNDVTLGYVQKVARTPKGKIELIVSYSKWFGWFGRPVAVPIEAVAILARQLDSVEMKPDEYEKAMTWSQGESQILSESDSVRVALGRR